MTPSPRKLAADEQCSHPTVSKLPRLSISCTTHVLPEGRVIAKLVAQPSRSGDSLQPTQDHVVACRPESKFGLSSSIQSTDSPVSHPWTETPRPRLGTMFTSGTSSAPTPCRPAVLHRPHPKSKLCQDFHWVPYPLGLMPHDSWHHLHHRDDMQPSLPFRCPVCCEERKATAHMRKMFLVAERLSWDEKMVSMHDKDLNGELNWKVNYELGILDPFVEDPEQVPGGKCSRQNKFYPYQNEYEMKLALKLVFMTEDLTLTTWTLWINTQLNLQKMLIKSENEEMPSIASKCASMPVCQGTALGATSVRHHTPEPIETIDVTGSPEPASRVVFGKSHGLRTPPWSLSEVTRGGTASSEQSNPPPASTAGIVPEIEMSEQVFHPKRIQSYKSLQDFYCLLDKIERTSYVGALFLEAYAEKLRDDMCKSCWLKHNINLDLF